MGTLLAAESLLVCWSAPGLRAAAHPLLLSFLAPSEDEALARTFHGTLLLAREASRAIRAQARARYLDLTVRIGLVPDALGRSFRQTLARPGEASRWWYHPVSFKDCEGDPAFAWIIAVLTIESVARRHGLARLVLVGAPREIARALRGLFHVEEQRPRPPRRWWRVWSYGIMSRAAHALRTLRQQRAVRRRARRIPDRLDTVIVGFWDWSVSWDRGAGRFADRYLKELPNALRRRHSIGWVAWLDPDREPGKGGRRLAEVLAPLEGRDDVVIVQRFLSPGEIVRAAADFAPLRRFLRIRRSASFRAALQRDGIDYAPLLSERLLLGFLDASLPHCELLALAMERACRRLRPSTALSFLEHFPYARAAYEGLRRSGGGTARYAIQHASYSHEKTFLFLDPSREFRGEPDGCPVPHPDYVCAMGLFSAALFRECGYPADRVLLTGSPRFDHVGSARPPAKLERHDGVRLLIISGLDVEGELDLVDAACAAARDLPGVAVQIRNHPFRRIDQHPGFAPYRDRVVVASGSLEENLAQADLLLFTYSTVAEEAFISGRPVWQWLPVGFNGSALAEAAEIPQFGSVGRLREALQEFCRDPGRFVPAEAARRVALGQLFYRGDGGAAWRIAEALGDRAVAVS